MGSGSDHMNSIEANANKKPHPVDEATTKIKDLTDALEQCRMDLGRRDERIKDLTADVEACHRTIAAGTRELEDARAMIQSLQTDALDAERLMSDQGASFKSRSAELHAEIMRLTGKIEELATEVQMLRNFKEADTALFKTLTEDIGAERERTQRAESRINTIRAAFRETVESLVERL